LSKALFIDTATRKTHAVKTKALAVRLRGSIGMGRRQEFKGVSCGTAVAFMLKHDD
jgi:hypothetical protein